MHDRRDLRNRINAFCEQVGNDLIRECSKWIDTPILLRQRKEVSKMKEAMQKLGKNAIAIIVILAAVLLLALIQKVAAVTPKQLIIVGTVVVLIEAINSWESVQKARIEQTKAKDP